MNRTTASILASALFTTGFWATQANAQPPIPGGAGGQPGPAVSPYINLLRGGSRTLNYFGIVRPEVQAQQSIRSLQGSVDANRQSIGDLRDEFGELPVTGHPVQFLNLGGYFLNSGGGTGSRTSTGRQGGPVGVGSSSAGAVPRR